MRWRADPRSNLLYYEVALTKKMDNKFSFLDMDGLFNDVGSPGDVSRQGVQGRGAQPTGGATVTMAGAPPLPPQPQEQPSQNAGFAEALDSIARALAYTEKRVASSEARLLAAMRDAAVPEKSQWSGSLGIFCGLVALFILIGLVWTVMKRSNGAQGHMPMMMTARGPTPMVISQGPMAPPSTFL